MCPKGEALTEECFQRPQHQLEFATDRHIVRFAHGGDKSIPNTVVRHGGGKGWMLNPIPMPNFVGSDCDDMTGHPCKAGCGFSTDKSCGGGYPGGSTQAQFPNPFGRDLEGKNTAIEDQVKVGLTLF